MRHSAVDSSPRRPGWRILASGFLVLACILVPALSAPAARAASNPKYASLIMDADTGMILHERNADKALHPASLVKMMTLLMVFEAVENGTLTLNDRVRISNHAAAAVPSKLNLPPGSSIRVEDAIYALVTKSANDIAIALGEKIGGTESHFAVMMTQRARAIGMSRTQFMNASGLHNSRQISTARDMAKLAHFIITSYPRYYRYFSTRQFTYQGATYRNHNRLMESYRGMDGFKTGYIVPSGFNLVSSAQRNGHRLIGVVFGGQSAASRNAHMKELLDKGFAQIGNTIMASAAPIPPRKPVSPVQMASLNNLPTAAGTVAPEKRFAALNPALQDNAFSELIGEGDYDPAVTNRLETGLMAIASVKEHQKAETPTLVRQPDPGAALQNAGSNGQWAVQIGAFSSRVKTDHALGKALKKLPQDLKTVTPVVVPLKTRDGWVFRGRLSGMTRESAQRACSFIKDCLPVSPQAY